MKTHDFIVKEFNNNDGREKWCSSVLKGDDGTIYSYGHHHPLLFMVNGMAFRNIKGYSVTTAKHISWCYDIGQRIYDVISSRDTSLEGVIHDLNAEYEALAKKSLRGRKGSRAQEARELRANDIQRTLNLLKINRA